MTDQLLAEADKTPVDLGKRSFLETLTGPGGKFYDEDPNVALEKVARGKYEADLYVKQLEARLDEMRADFLQMKQENESRANLEELIDQLSTPRETDTRNTPITQEVSKPTIDPTQIENLVSNAVRKIETAKKQEENWNVVKNKLVERYGENWDAHITKQVADLGMTNEDATVLAKKSPTAFIRTFGLDQTPTGQTFQAPPKSQGNVFTPAVTPKRNWIYYENLRKEKPDLYFDPKTQIQLHKDAIALGDDFERN
jgi:predicted house-cleaning noncanonical NTP pyrophosphatase (MazG superfamily)